MVTEVTNGVKVSVEVEYQPNYSSPSQHHYVFTYQVTIENNSSKTLQLKRRKWVINDAAFPVRVVEGEGVVGRQPVLEPGQSHQYISGCNLRSGLGKMSGSYEMEKLMDGQLITIQIPEFRMVVPFKLN
ncbi:MAG: Co2+/Mg2+ efflux protein ApaG [Cyclobacteriaceae bacterium]|nr:Co2+/Mg2+ efflux protein ApaG [Cyclobacteriaceae bacterium]